MLFCKLLISMMSYLLLYQASTLNMIIKKTFYYRAYKFCSMHLGIENNSFRFLDQNHQDYDSEKNHLLHLVDKTQYLFFKKGTKARKLRKFTLTEKIFREINSFVTSLVKAFVSRNFCQKRVRVILTHAFSKNFVKLMFLIKKLRTHSVEITGIHSHAFLAKIS